MAGYEFHVGRENIGWTVSYAYIVYIYIGQIPQLKPLVIFSTVSVSLALIMAFAVTAILASGYRKTLTIFVLGAAIGSIMELLSIHTGIPFGLYRYTASLGPLVGPIPLFIPLLWASLSFYAIKAGGWLGMPFVMTFLDLSFDPRFSGRLWIWISKTQYFGDPLSNFAGWFITSGLIIVSYMIVTRQRESPEVKGIIFYFLFGINNCISDLYYHLYNPALISAIIFTVSSAILYGGITRKKMEKDALPGIQARRNSEGDSR